MSFFNTSAQMYVWCDTCDHADDLGRIVYVYGEWRQLVHRTNLCCACLQAEEDDAWSLVCSKVVMS